MYAIIENGGRQYKAVVGQSLLVEKLAAEKGQNLEFTRVLLLGGDQAKIGNPLVAGATVEAEVLGDRKAKKVLVFKKKRRKGYHKKQGHRQQYTEVKITKINA